MQRSADSWVQNIWYGGSSLRWLLLPFSWIYSAVITCRRFLYAAGLFRSARVAVPVIIVGNITAGGTGKTPLTIWLAQQLSERGYKPGIICRGYGGMVGPNPVAATSEIDPAVVGDEAVMIANRSECPVVVHPVSGQERFSTGPCLSQSVDADRRTSRFHDCQRPFQNRQEDP